MSRPFQQLPDPAAVESALQRVFARPEFQPAEKGAVARALASVFSFVRDVFRWVWDQLEGGFSSPIVAYTALSILGVLLAVLIVRIVRTFTRGTRPTRAMIADRGLESTRLRGWRDLLDDAARLAGESRHLEAAHALYAGVLHWLDGAGHARFESSKTGGEYAREVQDARLAAPFRSMLGAYYPVAFGGRPDARGAFSRMRDAAGTMGVPL